MYRFLLIIFPFSLFAQQEPHPCHQVEQTELLLNNLSESERQSFYDSQNELEQFTLSYIESVYAKSDRVDDTIYIIPIVFHVIHGGGIENISDEQILDCVNTMNMDFRKLNADTSLVNQAFKSIVADSRVEFRLARKDPSGNCSKGITRTFSTVTYDGNGTQRIQAVQNEHGNWPGNRYLNVFVAANIGGAAGYTYRPSNNGSVGTTMNNGIHILHNYVGSIGTGTIQRSRTMTHEVGHWLNLPHTWGNSNNPGLPENCNGDDGVADTPNTIGWTSCNINGESCGSLDNVQNYMEYSYCSRMFTEGQKLRMHAALSSTVGGRNNIGTQANLNFTGVSEPEVFCRADFRTNTTVVCEGANVDFFDDSYFNPTEWSWVFEGGVPATSNQRNPTVTYNNPGTYAVTLTSGDGVSSDLMARTNYITVLPSQENLPFMESFENYSSVVDANGVWNVEPVSDTWEIHEGNAHTGSKSIRLMNIGRVEGQVRELTSGSFDLSNLHSTDKLTLTFRYSFKQQNSANTDRLRVFASTNCGETWATRRQLLSSVMSLGVQTENWAPEGPQDWITNHVTNITSAYFVNGMRVKFEWEHGGGNNIYLDDINIYLGTSDPLSISEAELVSEFTLFPNPSVEEVTVRLALLQPMNFDVTIMDLSGKSIQSHTIYGQQGLNDVMLDVRNLASGMYMVEVNAQGGKIVKQLVKH